MSASNDFPAYADCYEFFERAMASERGVRVHFDSVAEAKAYRFRMNTARQLDRGRNRRIYATDPNHPAYGRSEYAAIIIVITYDEERDIWLMELRKATAAILDLQVEDIPGPEHEDDC
jgi:hypothetical protein